MGSTASLTPITEILQEVGVIAAIDKTSTGGLRLALVNGKVLDADVRVVAHPTAEELKTLPRRWTTAPGRIRLLIADSVPHAARQTLVQTAVSFFDRRGRLMLVSPDVLVEADTRPVPRHVPRTAAAGIRGEALIATSVAALLSPDAPPGVRDLSRVSGMSPAAISGARSNCATCACSTTATVRWSPSCSGR